MNSVNFLPIDYLKGSKYNDDNLIGRATIMYDCKINVNTNKEIKEKATKIFNELGFDLTTAINVFLRKTIMCNGLPFDLYLDDDYGEPSEETLEAMKECDDIAEHPENHKGYTDLDEMWKDLHK
ncbi:MAG: type II toxin-antitoxin system RelB/DinJ family antitoxin [Coprobacillus sp.]|nr:type II toxin-antitoxin system RelB/DinJ family antitoxin [Coprobacillus sp.]